MEYHMSVVQSRCLKGALEVRKPACALNILFIINAAAAPDGCRN